MDFREYFVFCSIRGPLVVLGSINTDAHTYLAKHWTGSSIYVPTYLWLTVATSRRRKTTHPSSFIKAFIDNTSQRRNLWSRNDPHSVQSKNILLSITPLQLDHRASQTLPHFTWILTGKAALCDPSQFCIAMLKHHTPRMVNSAIKHIGTLSLTLLNASCLNGVPPTLVSLVDCYASVRTVSEYDNSELSGRVLFQ